MASTYLAVAHIALPCFCHCKAIEMLSLLFGILSLGALCRAANDSVLPLNIPPSLFWYDRHRPQLFPRPGTHYFTGTATMDHGQPFLSK